MKLDYLILTQKTKEKNVHFLNLMRHGINHTNQMGNGLDYFKTMNSVVLFLGIYIPV